ncbi:MAG: NAD(P)-dependent oxidoreductase [Candidatus Cloacimonadota bacterium]|nr:MAG: NAD(P)-dependent oxidoreductase [Candidatus Cloacimonadota bacterium]
MKRTVFITGATSGIGYATAEFLARQSYRLILCGRRKERLKKIEEKLSDYTEIKILSFDASNRKECEKAVSSLPEEWQKIDILINNAGNAHGLDSIQNGDIEDWDNMIDINVKGLLYVSKMIIPGMVERKSGHVINIGSIAGKEVYPKGNVYCASKHAADALNKSMLIDLNGYNIKVSAVNPGLVETEFSEVRFKGNSEKARKVYEGFDPLQAEDIAEVIFFLITRPSHVNIADITVFPTAQASSIIVNREK